jgi:hypothetical protein
MSQLFELLKGLQLREQQLVQAGYRIGYADKAKVDEEEEIVCRSDQAKAEEIENKIKTDWVNDNQEEEL